MILIGKTANCLLGAYVIAHSAMLKAVDIAVVLVDDDFPYRTSKVGHLIAFTAIFSNICTAHAQKRLFVNFRWKFDTTVRFPDPDFLSECKISAILATFSVDYYILYSACLPYFYFSNICTAHAQKRLFMNYRCKFRHRRSIRRPRFPSRVQNFGYLATFAVDFLHFICRMSAIFPVCLSYWPRMYITRVVYHHVDNSRQVWSWYDRCRVTAFLSADTARDFWPLTIWPWTVFLHGGSRGQPCHREMGSKTITFLESPPPICLFTIQLLLGYDDD